LFSVVFSLQIFFFFKNRDKLSSASVGAGAGGGAEVKSGNDDEGEAKGKEREAVGSGPGEGVGDREAGGDNLVQLAEGGSGRNVMVTLFFHFMFFVYLHELFCKADNLICTAVLRDPLYSQPRAT
jgi:hypothetical protein